MSVCELLHLVMTYNGDNNNNNDNVDDSDNVYLSTQLVAQLNGQTDKKSVNINFNLKAIIYAATK